MIFGLKLGSFARLDVAGEDGVAGSAGESGVTALGSLGFVCHLPVIP